MITPSSDKVGVTGIHADDIDRIWDRVQPMIEVAVDKSMNADDIYGFLKNRDMQLWVTFRDSEILSACTTEIIIYPQSRRLRVVTLGGEWCKELQELIEEFVKAKGIDAMEIVGRKGWTRRLKPFGYEQTAVVLIKEFSHE
ncbi:hypothetical protein KAR91_11700 [Candidatus Pacearchaeota archaeon]|nr:hypothetical protein [Candidatus Pacearchaeota archaeon]